MNYTQQSAGGSITELKYNTFNFVGQDFTKLNTTPIQILNSGNTFIPISITVKYNCTSGLGIPFLIGFETLLSNYLTGCWYSAPTTTDHNIFTSQYDFSAGGSTFSNIQPNSPLVIWQASDTPLAFSEFIVNLLYLEVTNL